MQTHNTSASGALRIAQAGQAGLGSSPDRPVLGLPQGWHRSQQRGTSESKAALGMGTEQPRPAHAGRGAQGLGAWRHRLPPRPHAAQARAPQPRLGRGAVPASSVPQKAPALERPCATADR